MEYDENFLVQAAERFEKKAHRIVVSYALRFTFLAALFSFAGAGIMQSVSKTEMPIGMIVLITSIFGLAGGIATGREKAFEFRVEAHKLLALVEIYRRTERPVMFPQMAATPHA